MFGLYGKPVDKFGPVLEFVDTVYAVPPKIAFKMDVVGVMFPKFPLILSRGLNTACPYTGSVRIFEDVFSKP